MTHARIATVRARPGSGDEVAARWRSLLEDYRATGAFLGMVAMYDRERDVATTLTLWSSAEAADRAAEELRPKALAAFADLLLEAPVIEPYDVELLEV